nr:phosphate transporter PHO1 [Tanacetum cinerariifolium]
MVKFSKQLEAQLIPEWKDAFVNYWQLKKQLAASHTTNSGNHDYGLSIFDLVRSLLRRLSFHNHHDLHDLNHDQILQVKSTNSDQHDGDGDGDGDVGAQAVDEDDETELVNHLSVNPRKVDDIFTWPQRK